MRGAAAGVQRSRIERHEGAARCECGGRGALAAVSGTSQNRVRIGIGIGSVRCGASIRMFHQGAKAPHSVAPAPLLPAVRAQLDPS